MSALNPDQLNAVAEWFAAGSSLDEIQKRLRAEFDVHMTYLDLRLLVADLPQPEEAPEPPPAKRAVEGAVQAAPSDMDDGCPQDEFGQQEYDEPVPGERPTRYDLDAPDADQGIPKPDVAVEMDALTIPGTLASGDVTFSDGIKGKWYLSQDGRLGLGNLPDGYRPSPSDAALFQSRLMSLLQTRGMI